MLTDDNSPANLPPEISTYLKDNYSGYNIESIDSEDICDDQQVFEVELEDGPGPDLELYFSLDGEYLFKAVDINKSSLPTAVLDAIATNFSGYTIDEDDLHRFEFEDGSIQYEVELDAVGQEDIDVIFAPDGSIICQKKSSDDDNSSDDNSNSGDDNGGDDNSNSGDDNGGDDNSNSSGDDNGSSSSGSTDDIKAYVKNNYPGYNIESIETEDICDDQKLIEVELEDGPGPDLELYFSLEGEFLFKATEINEKDLPAAVLAVIAKDFAGYSIDDDHLMKFELADGSLQYEVELEGDDKDDQEIIFAADGSIVCRKKKGDD
jgi:uncharacterized membrane protein YkoI